MFTPKRHQINDKNISLESLQVYTNVYYPVRKVSDRFFRKPSRFQCSALAWDDLNLHTHEGIFPRLSIGSVYGKQRLSKVVFSALVRFSLYTTSTHHRVKKSPKSTKGMPSVAYVMLCGARDWSCGQQAIGAFIMTMLQYIPPFKEPFWLQAFLKNSFWL